MYHTMKTIRSDAHQLRSYELNKVSLPCFNDKRYILHNGIESYAYRHSKIKMSNVDCVSSLVYCWLFGGVWLLCGVPFHRFLSFLSDFRVSFLTAWWHWYLHTLFLMKEFSKQRRLTRTLLSLFSVDCNNSSLYLRLFISKDSRFWHSSNTSWVFLQFLMDSSMSHESIVSTKRRSEKFTVWSLLPQHLTALNTSAYSFHMLWVDLWLWSKTSAFL